VPARHDIDAETELWDTYAGSAFKDDMEPVFNWTQYAGHGPGPEVLGEPDSVLEIGCGTGRALAFLAGRGVKATGVDLSPVMVKKATERWGPLGRHRLLRSTRPPARDHRCVDAIYHANRPGNEMSPTSEPS
jgi:SAM-dependent methyltransferase